MPLTWSDARQRATITRALGFAAAVVAAVGVGAATFGVGSGPREGVVVPASAAQATTAEQAASPAPDAAEVDVLGEDVVAPEAPALPEPIDHPVLEWSLAPVLDAAPGIVGVAITAEDGSPVYARHADVPLVPASTQKNVVAAAALHRFGADHRYVTELRMVGELLPGGILAGDLVLVGGGDPTLGTPDHGAVVVRPRTPLEHLADLAAAAGIRQVLGGVIADDGVLAYEPVAQGWTESHLARGHAARVSGLTVDGGRRMFRTAAGRVASEPAADPAGRAADALQELLGQRGVEILGPSTLGRLPELGSELVGQVHSAPMAQLVAHMVQASDNQLADGIFRSLGAADGDPTWAGAAEATRAALAELPLRWDGVVLTDGSGLSRENRLTPELLADLAAAMGTSELRGHWDGIMALSGHRGTLRNRMRGTPAEGRVLAKTGTLSDVRSLSGTVVGPHGTRYHFAIIGNGVPREHAWSMLAAQDRLAVALVEDLARCADPEMVPEPLRC